MTDGAMVRKVMAGIGEYVVRRVDGIGEAPCSARYGKTAHRPCRQRFEGRRLITSTEAAADRSTREYGDHNTHEDRHAEQSKQYRL